MVALLWVPGVASAATILTQATPTTWTLISDGTSNTILLSELSSLDVCVPSTSVPPSSDGSSSTLLLSETSAIGVVWSSSNFGAVDGTSNTILIGEDFCYRGIRTPTPIGQITDGTSISSIFACQPRPMFVNRNASTPPMTMPPGNQACRAVSFAVFSLS